MSKEEFTQRFNELKNKYSLFWTWSCDLLSIANVLVYKDADGIEDRFITEIDVNTPDGREKGISDIERYFISNE
ncbi:hypothetical protein [Dysgonomonas termitidis]|uniref:Uncharacterized protein n=1 Tax=Dysgonomonas termitidis TaxID=1516126 RepID=A0ABV9KTJ9_9BACT